MNYIKYKINRNCYSITYSCIILFLFYPLKFEGVTILLFKCVIVYL